MVVTTTLVLEHLTHIQYYVCLIDESTLSNLQPRKECLEGVNPGVHYLTTEHVHINIERRVALSFITGLSPEKRVADRLLEC